MKGEGTGGEQHEKMAIRLSLMIYHMLGVEKYLKSTPEKREGIGWKAKPRFII